MFLDEVRITVRSGKGGDGRVAFHREPRVPKGGPSGGHGGRGGDVRIEATSHKNTLIDFRHVSLLSAKDGERGGSANCSGSDGEDLIIRVPAGTLIYDDESGELIADLDRRAAGVLIAKGGKGGRGNASFATPTDRAPRRAEPGGEAVTRPLRLELKLLADVGIIGVPSAGKSTLIAAISSARPKIGDYPFTTLVPNLGVVERFRGSPFVVADVPGLIEGAHLGKGLGIQFLKHIQRTRLLVHLLDCTRDDPERDWEAIRGELTAFDPALAAKPELVVLNKVDTLQGGAAAPAVKALAAAFRGRGLPFLALSAATRTGCDDLLKVLAKMLKPQGMMQLG
jgi:GTP-binding protein